MHNFGLSARDPIPPPLHCEQTLRKATGFRDAQKQLVAFGWHVNLGLWFNQPSGSLGALVAKNRPRNAHAPIIMLVFELARNEGHVENPNCHPGKHGMVHRSTWEWVGEE